MFFYNDEERPYSDLDLIREIFKNIWIMYKLFGKRIMDLILGVAGFLITLPILITISILLFTINRKVFFVQRRPGLNGKTFPLIKFRTLCTEDQEKLLPCGSMLRRLSLDELPQLLNVIAGHMSMVGPRPLLEKYLSLYSPQAKRRMEIKPGLTGLVQISGRNCLSWEEKFALDLKYVDTFSFKLDVVILSKTFLAVLKTDKKETMIAKEFTGFE